MQIDESNIENEIFLMNQRLNHALPFLESLFESKNEAQKFVDEYLSAMQQPDVTYFYTKFIVTAEKPISNLNLIWSK